MTTPHADARTRTDSLIRVTKDLASVMEQESALLRQMRTREIESLQAHKSSAASAYEQAMADLQRQPDPLRSLDHGRIAELRSLATHLETAAKDNALALQAATAANQRMAQAVADAAREHQATQETYRRDGRLGRARPTGAPVSLSLNQTL